MNKENEKVIAHLYFAHNHPIRGAGFWKKLWSHSLKFEILKRAKLADIEQAIGFHVTGGYLKGDRLHLGEHEITPHKFPQCVELIDDEDKINLFLEKEKELLHEVKVLLFKIHEVLKPSI